MMLPKMKIIQTVLLLIFVVVVMLYFKGNMLHYLPKAAQVNIRKQSFIATNANLRSEMKNVAYGTISNDLYRNVRVQRMRKICGRDNATYWGKGNLSFNVIVDDEHDIIFCQIQKVGSTFWKQVLEYTRRKDEKHYSSPFRVSFGDMQLPHLGFPRFRKHKQKMLDNSFKFLFVREPYGRFFSGYVDKFFSPNLYYWTSIGKYIQNNTRSLAHRTVCAHDVTFKEFVSYIIQSESDGLHRDRHFTPEYEHCQPCYIKYDFIGKMETFKDDALQILKVVNQKTNNTIAISKNFKVESEIESIKEKVSFWFSAMNKQVKCTPKHEILVKMWKTLQIRGILSKKVSLPFSKYDAFKVTEGMFKRLVLQAYERYKYDQGRHRNKMEALIEAYSTVPPADMIKLQAIVKPDCELFNYDLKPFHLFNTDTSKTTGYSYLDFTSYI